MADPIAQLEDALIALVRRANDPRGNRALNRAAGTDIERAAAVMLARVDELEPARLSDLACAAGVDVSTASRQVARLVEDGYVQRRPDPDDGRATAHSLTDAGREARAAIVAARRRWFEVVLDDFDADEQARFADLFSRFMDRIVEVDDTWVDDVDGA